MTDEREREASRAVLLLALTALAAATAIAVVAAVFIPAWRWWYVGCAALGIISAAVMVWIYQQVTR